MAYGFNDDKSKADVYTKSEIDTKFTKFYTATAGNTAAFTIEPNSTATVRLIIPEAARNVTGVIGLRLANYQKAMISRWWVQAGEIVVTITNITSERLSFSSYQVEAQFVYCSANE